MKIDYKVSKWETFTGRGNAVPQKEITDVTITLSLNEMRDLLSDAEFGAIPNIQELTAQGCLDLVPSMQARREIWRCLRNAVETAKITTEDYNEKKYQQAKKKEVA